MRRNNTDLYSDNSIYTNRDPSTYISRSYTAMILSAIIPGLGQIYLHHVVKGCFIFFIFVSAVVLLYMNSYPVKELSDLFQFQLRETNNTSLNTDSEHDNSIQLWTYENGKTLMFRPSWILKITAFLQGLICWIYAVFDGWRGRPEYSIAISEND